MLNVAIFVGAKSKAELFIVAIYLGFLVAKMNSYSCAREGFIVLHGFAARAGAQKLHHTGEVQNNFRRIHGISWCLVFQFYFFGVFHIFRKKASLYWLISQKDLFQLHFYGVHVILRDRNNSRAIFFALSPFVSYFVFILRCVRHGVRGAPVEISLQDRVLIFRAETPVLGKKETFLLCSITGFSICSIPKIFLPVKVGRCFHIQTFKKNIYRGGKKQRL